MIGIMRFSFAIIGGGLTATAMLCQLVDRMQEKAKKGQLDPLISVNYNSHLTTIKIPEIKNL